MKILGILLVFVGAIRITHLYILRLKDQLKFLQDWEKIFRCWKDWIERYSYSLDELIYQTTVDPLTSKLNNTYFLKDKTVSQLIDSLSEDVTIPADDITIVMDLLGEFGGSVMEHELAGLDRSIDKLQLKITEREKTVRERAGLLYKLVPLLCGALAVILW